MSTILPPNSLPSALSGSDLYGSEPARLVLRPLFKLDEEEFFQLVAQNPDQPLEQNAQGEVIIVSPTGSYTGWLNGKIFYQVYQWNETHQRGLVFDSSSLFRLPNRAALSPDVAWVEKSRWQRLTLKQQKGIAPISPNFVIELRSETDRLDILQDKLAEYVANGVEVGWLIDPLLKQVHVYEAGQTPKILDQPETVAGTWCIQGFVLDLREIFSERQ
jgi:Uma2 family endonuclease